MGLTLEAHEPEKRVEKCPYRHVVLPKTRDLDPSSYFPSSFGWGVLRSCVCPCDDGIMLAVERVTPLEP
jgi:hypothetical protein